VVTSIYQKYWLLMMQGSETYDVQDGNLLKLVVNNEENHGISRLRQGIPAIPMEFKQTL
jgi:hypothetical protein